VERKRILITGASGFIGSFLCEESLKRGFSTWAALRATSSRRWLQKPDLQFITLDLTNRTTLRQQLKGCGVRFDVVIHAAGATKCLKAEEFDFHNYQCTRNLVEALMEADLMPRQLIYLSSLSATYGSTYGNSKLQAEQ
jgi:nucleoside-diphosphate-sugar epimerase